MNLYAYTRVSTEKQLKGKGLEIQKKTIERYSKAYGHKIVTWFCDRGASAYKLRPDFEKMMKEVDQADGIIVSDITRFGRNTTDLLININNLNDNKKTFISVGNNIDISTKDGKLLLGVLSLLADYERTTIRERLEAGKEYAKDYGTKSGKPMHRPRIEINWRYVDGWVKKGLSLSRIAIVYSSELEKISAATLYSRYKERVGFGKDDGK